MSVHAGRTGSLVSRLTPVERLHLATALSAYVIARGRDRVPAALVVLLGSLEAIGGHSRPYVDNRVEDLIYPAHCGLVTYSEASSRLGVSRRTVGRRVAAGDLVTIGRRITITSLEALQRRS